MHSNEAQAAEPLAAPPTRRSPAERLGQVALRLSGWRGGGTRPAARRRAEILRERERYLLVLTPEGMPKRTERWRSGFYTGAEAFDIRAFHDAVLAQGRVPLPFLREEVKRLIAGVEAGVEAGH